MYKLAPLQDVHLLETVLDVVLDSLDVVICHFLDFLHFGCILRSHSPVDVSERFKLGAVEICKLWKRNPAQSDEILDLYADAILDECVLAEIFSKRFCLTRVSSVNRRDCQK